MIREQTCRARQKLVSKLLVNGELLRLLDRTGPAHQRLSEMLAR